MKVRDRATNEEYNAYPQSVSLGLEDRYVLRYIIGIDNYQGFHMIEAIYDNDEFNQRYEVIDAYTGTHPGYLAQ